jgi:predicted DNA-binding protein (MmcQ/YjbR family)
MTKQAVGAGADQIRALALAYPEAVEEFPWGHTAVKVRGKAFLFMGGEPGKLSLSCKLPASHGAALLLPFASPTGYGLGKSGWVTAVFPAEANLPIALLAEWLDESYRAVAPKKLAALVGGSKGMSEGAGAKGQGAKGMSESAGKPAKASAKKTAKAGAEASAKKAAKAGAKASAKKTAKAGAKASAKKAAKAGAEASAKKAAKAGAKASAKKVVRRRAG